jgi:hypothetical protein
MTQAKLFETYYFNGIYALELCGGKPRGLLKNGEEIPLTSYKGNKDDALHLLYRLLETRTPQTCDDLRKALGKALRDDTIFHYMRSLADLMLPKFWTYSRSRGKTVGTFTLIRDVGIKRLQGRYADQSGTILRERVLELLAGPKKIICPVVHTLSLIKQEDGSYREAWKPDDHDKSDFFYSDLTGYGEAEGLRLLEQICQPLGILLEPSIPAKQVGIDFLLRTNVCWLGSPFNETHCFYARMRDLELWASAPKCLFEGMKNMVLVRYPDIQNPTRTIEETVNEWPRNRTEGNAKRFALLRCVAARRRTPRDEEGTRVFIAAGTDTLATLFAMEVLAKEEKRELLEAAVGTPLSDLTDNLQFEALFQLGLPTNMRRVQLVWPRYLTFEDNHIVGEGSLSG